MSWILTTSIALVVILGPLMPVGSLGLELEDSPVLVGTLDLELEDSPVLVGTLGLTLEDARPAAEPRVRGIRGTLRVGSLGLELEGATPPIGTLELQLEGD